MMAQRIIAMDKNGDGKVSRDEFTGVPANFDRLDANKDGFITRNELPGAAGAAAGAPNRAMMRQRLQAMDKNNDGVITRAEWSGNDQSFREHDTNGDGILSGDEVRPGGEAILGKGRSLVRFDQADRNGDGRIARDEWTGSVAAFNRVDRNGDGVITRDEYSTGFADRAAGTSGDAAMNQADRSRREEISARFNRIDRNGDGLIDADEAERAK